MRPFSVTLLLILLIVTAVIFQSFFRDNFGSEIRFINDNADREVYYLRGTWYTIKKTPYTEVFSEYPQFATYFFALPHMALAALYGPAYGKEAYYLTFSAMMMLFLSFTILLLYRLRDEKRYFAFLMLLPASLYFSYNRYDILPSFLGILAVYLLSKKKFAFSFFCLALGVLAKWYLALLFPIFLVFCRESRKKNITGIIAFFFITCFLGILPTLLSGGIDALLIPYMFHTMRGLNSESLFYLLKKILGSDLWFIVFFVLQFSVWPFLVFARIDSPKKAINWSALAILVFMLFAKFYSPQWILWIMPFLILRIRNAKDAFLVIFFDITTYVYYPVIYDGFGGLLTPVIILKTSFLMWFIYSISRDCVKDIEIPTRMRFLLRQYTNFLTKKAAG
ncbi:MAG: hypothetical protein JW994_07650 [Candidatus Omnitrophica bacterium]|nr:hypothetical protein [Candidatus Omnitrophota bacterium]